MFVLAAIPLTIVMTWVFNNTKGSVLMAILVHAMGRGIEDLWLKDRLDNCQISRLEWTAEDGLRLLELSDVSHLHEVGSLGNWRTTDDEVA